MKTTATAAPAPSRGGCTPIRPLASRAWREQRIAAELVGADPARLPATRADLEAYVDEQRHWLSLSLAAAEVTHALRKPNLWGNPVKVFTFVVVQDGMLSLLPEWARLMYGIEGRPMNLRAAARTTKQLIGIARKNESYDKMVAEITTRIDETPYRKVRARKA
ncbi:oxygenase MpaB family protein [Rhodococcus sp. R1101]|uniref:oxygenase MpaB family protein n=1 Tax=Rhodococcus sp. R1101 TaxID=1170698 RepID=UPI0003064422|nr:oxygenase MpaB family protein [Rhodococcus sp. R1101]